MGPRIKRGVHILGQQMSVFDVAPTVPHIYGVAIPLQMKGRVLAEVFEGTNERNITTSSLLD